MENFISRIYLDGFDKDSYLFEIDGLKKFKKLDFTSPITIFTGENGSGKSTLLEAIAVNWGFNPEGGSKNFNFSTHDTHSPLYSSIRLVKSFRHAKDGFFLRAESFYNVASNAQDIGIGIENGFIEWGGKPSHEQSHGESFLNLVNNRFRGDGLYILDEPESALSMQRQLSLMVSLKELADEGSQIIIATHSPLLLSLPGAQIISLDSDSPLEIDYQDSKPYQLLKLFYEDKDLLFSKLFD